MYIYTATMRVGNSGLRTLHNPKVGYEARQHDTLTYKRNQFCGMALAASPPSTVATPPPSSSKLFPAAV